MLWKCIQIFSTIKYKHKSVNITAFQVPPNSTDNTAASGLLQPECGFLPHDLSTCGTEKTGLRERQGTNSHPGRARPAACAARGTARSLQPQPLLGQCGTMLQLIPKMEREHPFL